MWDLAPMLSYEILELIWVLSIACLFELSHNCTSYVHWASVPHSSAHKRCFKKGNLRNGQGIMNTNGKTGNGRKVCVWLPSPSSSSRGFLDRCSQSVFSSWVFDFWLLSLIPKLSTRPSFFHYTVAPWWKRRGHYSSLFSSILCLVRCK